ncbi:FecCD family ABC transporter permease [Nonomuraea sp. KM90]|uniref:FecCD family ABC transporter permease n=1 Tax=Nonomuraea sp. KM90 TaxID=3457428 RepID=UPI003FCEE5DF
MSASLDGRPALAAGRPAAAAPWAVALGLALLALAAVCLGTPFVTPQELLLAAPDSIAQVVVWELRVPRVMIGLAGGAAIGAAGLLLQESLRNPLAVPEMIGVSTGAALAVSVCVIWALPVPYATYPLIGLLGAACGGFVTLAVARTAGTAGGVLLVGAAVSTAIQALLLAVMATADRLQYDMLFRYLVGSLSGLMWEQTSRTLPWLAAAVPLVVLCVPALTLLRLGDDAAASLGSRVERARLGVLAVAALLIGCVTGPCGPIAWVGFLAPVLARRLRPHADARVWLPWSAALGALVTLAADLAARLAFAPAETPLGAWTALAGVLAGAVLLRKRVSP